MSQTRPRVAVVNDYELVVAGLSAILAPFEDRIEVADPVAFNDDAAAPIDVALYDTFGRPNLEAPELADLVSRDDVSRVAIYSFNFDDAAVQQAVAIGASAYLSKMTPADVLVDQLVAVAQGDQVFGVPVAATRTARDERGWPGQDLGLSEREAEVVALAALGRRNADIAAALYVTVDTVKTHLARAFRKLDVHNRTELSALVHRRPSFRRLLDDA